MAIAILERSLSIAKSFEDVVVKVTTITNIAKDYAQIGQQARAIEILDNTVALASIRALGWSQEIFIEVGIENEQTVVYVPAQPELGLAPQTIVTVTESDANVNGTTEEELAQSWRTNIHLSLSSALWGHQLDVQHPWWRWGVGAPIKLDKTGQPYTRSRVRADNFGVKTAAYPNFWYKYDTFARQF